MDPGDDTTTGGETSEDQPHGGEAPAAPRRRAETEDRSAEVTGPRATVVLGASVAAIALAIAGVIGWQAWQDDDDGADEVAPTVAPTVPREGEPEPDDIGGFLFVRTTDEGIEVRAQRNDAGAVGGGGMLDDDGVTVDEIGPAVTEAPAEVDAEPEPEPFAGARSAPPTTAVGPDPRPVPLPMPVPVDTAPGTTVEGGPGDEDGDGRPDICNVIGDLVGWAITDDAILQGGGPLTEGAIPELYPSVLWPGEQPTVLALVVQVDDTVSSVRLTGPNGAADEMAPVEGAVVLALRSDVGFEGDPAVLRPFTLTAERADGTTMRADWGVLQRGHPAWNGDAACNPGVVEPPAPPEPAPVPELPEPGEAQPPDPATARDAIAANLSDVYTPEPAVDPLTLVDDPYGIVATLEVARANGFGDGDADFGVEIDDLVFVSATDAMFSYTLTASGIDYSQQLGRARLLDGVWKISRSTLCQDLSKAGATCPP